MAKRGTDQWSEAYCDRRFHPPYLTGLPYWFFCRLEPGHDGDCDCEAAHEAAAEATLPMCEHCGKKFDVGDARSEFDADDEWAGELTYDEQFPEYSICGSCAIAITVENLGAGRAMLFSLETGLPPEDVPDHWSPSADGGIAPW